MRLFILAFLPILLPSVICGGEKTPDFGPIYQVKAILTIPYAEIQEPLQGWFDAEANISRVDYYNGMVKTIQFPEEGISLKLAPMTTDDQLNVPTCFRINSTKVKPIELQPLIPDLSNFKLIGNELANGYNCEKWHMEKKDFEMINKYVIFIRRQETANGMIPVPVRYEMRGYNLILQSHFDHWYMDYYDFSTDKPNEEVFTIHHNYTCTHFPGPGSMHVHSFNPIKEFVGNHEEHVDHLWKHFTEKHNKTYNETENEHHVRKSVFRQNLRFINSKNRANLGYQLSINHLTDRTDDERKVLRGKIYTASYNGGSPFPYIPSRYLDILPEEFDWRIYGAVTPVKDQSYCGSCWTYGTTGAVEGAYFVKTGKLLRLSTQALIDCSWGYGNNGCDGGEDYRAYAWIMKHGGLPLESDYGGYLGEDGYCHIENVTLYAGIKGYVNITSGDANALKLALFKHGPISVSVDASQKSFDFYSHGVYYEPKCKNGVTELDHSVLAVGYGKYGGEPYWLIKNSWSNYWGNDGYILLSARENNCGVLTMPTYVIM